MNGQIFNDLRISYDRKASEWDQYEVSEWKQGERQRILSLLRGEGKHQLLDVGAGTRDSWQILPRQWAGCDLHRPVV